MTSIETFVVAPTGATNLAPPGTITALQVIDNKTTILLVAELKHDTLRKAHPVVITALEDGDSIPDNARYIGTVRVGFNIVHFYIGR